MTNKNFVNEILHDLEGCSPVEVRIFLKKYIKIDENFATAFIDGLDDSHILDIKVFFEKYIKENWNEDY